MLEDHLESPVTIRRLRSGPAAPYVDGFADWLAARDYKPITISYRLRWLARYSDWARDEGEKFGEEAESVLDDFENTLIRNGRFRYRDGKLNWVVTAARQFTGYLQNIGIARSAPQPPTISELYPSLGEFADWLRERRGLKDSTVGLYQHLLTEMLRELGSDPERYTAARIRLFILEEGGRYGIERAKSLTTAVRAFLRFLGAMGRCATSLEYAVPSFASWRLSSVPRYMEQHDVERVIAACDPDSAIGARDRAVVLLLARLGLRRGDVSALIFEDIDWQEGRLAVAGKSRLREWLPLPQEVGNAILHYLQTARPPLDSPRVFCSAVAPFRPLTPHAVTHVAKAAIRRAEVEAPSYGAHVFRHSAATAMLRQGASLHSIGAVIRHRSRQMTAHYAKVDFDLLREIAQPWPEASSS